MANAAVTHIGWLLKCHPQTKASQRVCLPSPEKEILKKMPHARVSSRTKNMTRTDKYGLLNRLTMWTENEKELKHDAPTACMWQ